MGQHGNLTDRKLASLKAAARGKHYDTWERDGFGVRVSDRGTRTFVLMARYHGAKSHPTRRAIGHYPTVTLAQARETAARWRQWISQGKDPAIEIERQKAAELRKHEATFAAVARDFIDTKVSKERAHREAARIISRVLVREWGKRPITDISALEVRNLIKRYVDAGKRTQAHHVLAMLRRLYNWAADQLVYGIETSPCDRLKPKAIIGARKPRTRVLTDIELRATWKAAALLGYPYGPMFQILIVRKVRHQCVTVTMCVTSFEPQVK